MVFSGAISFYRLLCSFANMVKGYPSGGSSLVVVVSWRWPGRFSSAGEDSGSLPRLFEIWVWKK